MGANKLFDRGLGIEETPSIYFWQNRTMILFSFQRALCRSEPSIWRCHGGETGKLVS